MNPFHDEAFMKAINDAFARHFVEEQTEEGVMKRLDRGDWRYAIKLMKAWFKRKPEDVETLKRLKVRALEVRDRVRATNAGYARTHRQNKRNKRVAADVRTCAVCQAPLAGKRAGAVTCSTRCRVALCRKQSGETAPDAEALQANLG
jgi:hypothetical protein